MKSTKDSLWIFKFIFIHYGKPLFTPSDKISHRNQRSFITLKFLTPNYQETFCIKELSFYIIDFPVIINSKILLISVNQRTLFIIPELFHEKYNKKKTLYN